MVELKTLKDIKEVIVMGLHPADVNIFREEFSKELKQEAIKWIKHIQNDIKELRDLESKPQDPLQEIAIKGLDEVLEGQIKVMTDFFNISEDDLNG